MKNNSTVIYRIFLALGDIFGLLLSFTAAYLLRVTWMVGSVNAPFHAIPAMPYITSVAVLLPFWLILFHFLGLYSSSIYSYRPKEIGRLFVAAALGIALMITVSFFTSEPLFPGKLVPIYAFIISFIVLVLIRTVLRAIRLKLLEKGIGTRKLLIVGNGEATDQLVNQIIDNPRSGYDIVGVVTSQDLPVSLHDPVIFSSLKQALEKIQPDVIIQTDDNKSNEVYRTAVDNHIIYQYIPAHEAIATSKHTSDIVGGLPIITVQTTPLMGYGRVVKRVFDVVVSLFAIIILSPIMALVALAVKLSDPRGRVLMHGKMSKRLTRYNKVFRVYKFRSHYARYDGKTDEEVFKMIGKPELIEEYRANGDKLKKDFRVTPVGRFIRRFSLDELPQLFNVLKGDLSLVGPRALVPHELSKYEKWHTLLSVKSGLTGLAVVSGRRNIGFEERRKLDLYYVQNWTFGLDISILLRTITVVVRGDSQ